MTDLFVIMNRINFSCLLLQIKFKRMRNYKFRIISPFQRKIIEFFSTYRIKKNKKFLKNFSNSENYHR